MSYDANELFEHVKRVMEDEIATLDYAQRGADLRVGGYLEGLETALDILNDVHKALNKENER